MNSKPGQDHIKVIQREYQRIDGKWLRMEYRLMQWLALFAVTMEVAMFFVLRQMDMIRISPVRYLLKYLAAPAGCNMVLLLIGWWVMRSHRLTETRKSYAVSLLFAVMAFVIYTVHALFPSMFAVMIIPMCLTVIYGDRRLIDLVAAVCIGGKVTADLFLPWDPSATIVWENSEDLANFGISIVMLVLVYVICRVLIVMEQEKNEVSIKLEQERRRFQEEAITDQLTQVWNRQALRQMFDRIELERDAQRHFLAIMDLDAFKNLNDTYGHPQGDAYLRALGAVLREVSTERIVPFRFGGDEFCVVFRACEGEQQVLSVCREIQARFAAAEVHRVCRPVTISMGAAELRQDEKPAQLLERADKALYEAKKEKGSIRIAE